jgi:acetyltransferase
MLAESGEFDVLISAIDHSYWLRGTERHLARAIAEDLRNAVDGTDIFPAVIGVTTADPPIEDLEWARDHDIPMLKGSLPGLRAIAARLDHSPYTPPHREIPADAPIDGAGALSELDSAAILAEHGVPYVRAERCASPDHAADAAERIGYPVVCKIDNVAHKARVGGVALHLTDAGSVRSAAERMGGSVVVAEQVSQGVEVLIGAVRDADYGATVAVGIGGGLAEQLDLVTAALAPLDEDGARRLVASLPVLDRLLGGHVPQGLIDAVVAVSQLVAEHPEVVEIDVNPLLVTPERAVALDCLIVLKEPA